MFLFCNYRCLPWLILFSLLVITDCKQLLCLRCSWKSWLIRLLFRFSLWWIQPDILNWSHLYDTWYRHATGAQEHSVEQAGSELNHHCTHTSTVRCHWHPLKESVCGSAVAAATVTMTAVSSQGCCHDHSYSPSGWLHRQSSSSIFF